jgi:hypothetical protein
MHVGSIKTFLENTCMHAGLGTMVARWNIFKPKIPIWVNFGGSCNGRC